jgi:ureidoacrylate peracid hydrolase
MIEVPARPEPFAMDARRAAVLVIDMQNDFGSPGGMFDRAGIDISGIGAAVGMTARVLAAARAAGVPVIYLTMEHAPNLDDAGPVDGPHRRKHELLNVGAAVDAPDGTEGGILVRGTWNTRIVDALAPEPGDHVVPKHRYSGFFETELDALLRRLDVRQVVVTGCTTSVCVESTVRDATFRDYSCLVLADCTAEPIGNGENHRASLRTIETLFGWVAESDALIAAIS